MWWSVAKILATTAIKHFIKVDTKYFEISFSTQAIKSQ